MLCFDILIFCMTLYKSLTNKNNGNSNILRVMLRDGALYVPFLLIVILLTML